MVFSDFQCPPCRRFAETLDSIKIEYPSIRIVERHFPNTTLHSEAEHAALAAECAAAIGRYASMRSALFANADLVAQGDWGAIASQARLADTARLLDCMDDGRLGRLVELDIAAGEALGISATPSLLLNDSLYASSLSLADIEEKIEARNRQAARRTSGALGASGTRRAQTRDRAGAHRRPPNSYTSEVHTSINDVRRASR